MKVIEVNVGDRILRKVIVKKERKWWQDNRPIVFGEWVIVESVVKEISPRGIYYYLFENGKGVWVEKKNLAVLEVLELVMLEVKDE